MSVNSINVLSKDSLINETFQKRRLEKQASLNLLSEVMGGVEIVKEKLDLICPYTKEKIKYPVRGRYCRHFGCACLETIIAFHNLKRQWICPQCDNKIN
jgi:SUMO ligase MMS21 Smc5/6 complex component